MPSLDIHLNGENCWPDLPEKEVIPLMGSDAPPIGVAVLDGGMTSGQPSVSLRLDLPDGRVVVTETSARLLCTLARMIEAKYPKLFQEP